MDQNVLIRVFDRDLNFLGEIDDYTSLVYRRKWSNYNEFEITLGYRCDLLQANSFFILDEDPRRNGYVEYIQYNEEEGTYTVKGFSLLKLLENRITEPPTGKAYQSYKGTPAEVMAALVTTNAISPTDSRRAIPQMALGESMPTGDSMTYESRYNVLLEDLKAIAGTYGLGIEVELDWQNQKLRFTVQEGVDHSSVQDERPRVIFSDFYDNISNQIYTLDMSAEKNFAYVAGSGEGVDRTVITIDRAGASGFDRKEIFVDARDVKEGDNEYTLLKDRGYSKLSTLLAADSYDFTALATTLQYLRDWDLGDLVTVMSEELGMTIHERILEVEEAYDASGVQITPTVGEPEKTLQEKLTGSGTSYSGGSGGGGTSASTYTYIQTSPAQTWNIFHKLGRMPSVTVVDSAGTVVRGEVEYIDSNTIKVSFSGGFSGKAYLN